MERTIIKLIIVYVTPPKYYTLVLKNCEEVIFHPTNRGEEFAPKIPVNLLFYIILNYDINEDRFCPTESQGSEIFDRRR